MHLVGLSWRFSFSLPCYLGSFAFSFCFALYSVGDFFRPISPFIGDVFSGDCLFVLPIHSVFVVITILPVLRISAHFFPKSSCTCLSASPLLRLWACWCWCPFQMASSLVLPGRFPIAVAEPAHAHVAVCSFKRCISLGREISSRISCFHRWSCPCPGMWPSLSALCWLSVAISGPSWHVNFPIQGFCTS